MARETPCKIKFAHSFCSIAIVLLGLLLVINPPGLLAQEKGAEIGFRSGVSFPLLDYQAQNLDDGSFAQAGFVVAVEGVYYFTDNLGAGFTSSLRLHPVDVVALAKARVNSNPFLSDLTIRSEPYTLITAMPGLFYKHRWGQKWNFTGKLALGLLYAKTPYQLYKPNYYLLPDTWEEITSAKDWSFALQPGIGINYKLSPCINIVFDTGFMYGKMQFDFATAAGTRTDEKQMSVFDLLLGFNVKLF